VDPGLEHIGLGDHAVRVELLGELQVGPCRLDPLGGRFAVSLGGAVALEQADHLEQDLLLREPLAMPGGCQHGLGPVHPAPHLAAVVDRNL
jgi:hypothetical protein